MSKKNKGNKYRKLNSHSKNKSISKMINELYIEIKI